ncbi:SMI1/KNR4 family protein [Streptacidiphilus carbonis]|jgi:cell wall assembly regulator SMI1|uniref:SMI1/KNR4 family protein n=1 Tax=Streptacidiphilus carbonis TaxID=105422 RepID=UPI000693478C|nr:SMI1/KNR4 family protein [Streptacidiphilus carbonis]
MTLNDHDLRNAHDRINAWLAGHHQHAPVRPVAAPEPLRALEADLGTTLPADIHRWWTMAGVSADFWIPGSFAPVALDEALETREIWLLVPEQEGITLDAGGHPEPRFHPSFLPIAMDPGGDGLIIDLRSGDSQGAVFHWDHETWNLGLPLWESVASMLQDTANALETGTPALLQHAAHGGHEHPCIAVVDDTGELSWQATAP